MPTIQFDLKRPAPHPNLSQVRAVVLGILFFGVVSFGLYMVAANGGTVPLQSEESLPQSAPMPWLWLLYTFSFVAMAFVVAGLWGLFKLWWPRRPIKRELVIEADGFHLVGDEGNTTHYYYDEITAMTAPVPAGAKNWRSLSFYVTSDKLTDGFIGAEFETRAAFEKAEAAIRSRIPPENIDVTLR